MLLNQGEGTEVPTPELSPAHPFLVFANRAGGEQMDKMNHSSAEADGETIEPLRYLR